MIDRMQFNLSSLSQHVHFQDSHFRYELSICNLIPKKLSSVCFFFYMIFHFFYSLMKLQNGQCYDENKKHMETYSCGFDRDLGVSQDLGPFFYSSYLFFCFACELQMYQLTV